MPIRLSAYGRVFAPSWPMTLLTLLLLAAFVSLGRWQWHRGQDKQAVWAQYERDSSAVALGSRDLDRVDRFVRLELHGEFDGRHQFLLDNRSHEGSPGYEALTPFTLSDGRRILVDRGWLPFTGYREKLPDISLKSAGPREITGRIDNLPAGGLAMGHAAPDTSAQWPKLTSFPTHEDLARALGGKLEQRMILLDANAPDGYVREWSPPGIPPSRHFSYAIQWWGFALVAGVLYFALNFRKVS